MDILIYLIISVIGGCSTFLISSRLFKTPIFSSAITTLIFCICLEFSASYFTFDKELLGLLFFGATFVGMANSKRFNIKEVIICSIIYSGIFKMFIGYNPGLGGVLGFMAFLSYIFLISFYKIKGHQK